MWSAQQRRRFFGEKEAWFLSDQLLNLDSQTKDQPLSHTPKNGTDMLQKSVLDGKNLTPEKKRSRVEQALPHESVKQHIHDGPDLLIGWRNHILPSKGDYSLLLLASSHLC